MVKILIVEDEKVVAMDIQNTVKTIGYEVAATVSVGEEAIRKAEESRPDLVLMDIVLRGEMDGIRTAEKIRQQFDIPVVYLTAYGDENTFSKAKISKPFGYILKPFDERELHINIEIALYRHQMERKLMASEARYRGVVENAYDAIYIITSEGFEYVNPAFEQLSGYTAEEVLDSNFDFWQTIYSEDRTFVKDRMTARAKRQSLPAAYQFRLITKSGALKTIEATTVDIGTADAIRIIGIIRDITERKNMELALRNERDRAQNYLDIAGVMILALNENADVTLVNEKGCEILGIDERDVLGKNWFDHFVPEEHREQMKAQFILQMDQDIEFAEYTESEIVTSTKKRRTIAWHHRVLKDGSGKSVGTLNSGEDISERLQAELALRFNEQKYRMLFDLSPTSITLVSLDGKILDCNAATQAIIGLPKDKLVGRSMFDLGVIQKDEAIRYMELFSQLIAGEKIMPFEAKITTGNNITRWIEVFPSIFKSANKLSAIQMIARDITDYRKLKSQLLQSQKMEAIGSLAGGVAHDFNNLLTAITGYTELLLGEASLSDPVRSDLGEIKQAADRAADLTRQLLAFSRRQPLQPKIIDLNLTAANMSKMLNRLIGEMIEMEISLQPNLPRIKADSVQIEQVIMNLAINAHDAMPEGGKLLISTRLTSIDEQYCRMYPYASQGDFVCLFVEDSGTGIDKSIMKHIFEPFFGTKAPGIGTGLGLSVVYGIVKQHGGWINVYSEQGQGAIFKAYFPAFSITQEDETQVTISLQKLKGHGEKILLIEDEMTVRDFVARALEEHGYEVQKAGDLKTAEKLYNMQKQNYSLIFTDVVLPDGSGIQLVNRLLKHRNNLKILFCSGYTEKKSKWTLIREQGFRYIQKPYTLTGLLQLIKEILSGVDSERS
ncbi:PAS domain S-box protein [candidate division KSB1 bacterium]|nr:PAS domain S-box protein [candidate division KSB1 bacterium]